MAKKRNKPKAEGTRESGPTGEPRSVLEAAWNAFEDGDMVGARTAARAMLAGPATGRDGAFAAELSPKLFGRPDAPADAAAVATELVRRTEIPPRTYLFAALAVFVFSVLLLISRRY